jgi:hypothetical protein
VANKEAKARIRINRLLENAGWRFFDDEAGPANIALEPNVRLTKRKLDGLGEDFEETANGFIDYLLLDERGFSIAVLEAKRESLDPLVGKSEQKGWQWLATREAVTSGEYAAAMGIPNRTALNHLKRFTDRGLLRRSGTGPATRYEVQSR